MTTTKAADKLTLRDRLSRLTLEQAAKALGPDGKRLILQESAREIDLREQVRLTDAALCVQFFAPSGGVAAVATVALEPGRRERLDWSCTACQGACEHVAAAFSCVLEHKTVLGLAAPPPERKPAAELSDEQIVAQALADRQERARTERMKIKSGDASTPWTDYEVQSLVSGKAYRVALRGLQPGDSYCTCPDFRTNTLGTCKHVLKVAAGVRRRFTPAQLKRPYRPRQIALHLRYERDVTLRLSAPPKLPPAVETIVGPLRDRPLSDVPDVLRRLTRLEAQGQSYRIYPDAEEFIQQHLHRTRIGTLVAAIRRDPANHPLRTSLLQTPLLPYQLEGVAFVAAAGRAVLADDMGLGKTIQAVGAAEFLAREVGIRKVLIVCPASLKSQWQNEIRRFCTRDVQLIVGRTAERAAQYDNERFFTVCNYEQVVKDVLAIERTPWDLIVLDEGQRIKNWEAKTSRVIKALKSRFALCLTGTPLENRLDDLYSVVQFVDDRRLGPGFRFFNSHRVVDAKGKVLGYRKLDDLRQRLQGVLLRRTRQSVQLQLPERSTEIVRVPPTDEQKALHDSHLQTVAQIVRKRFLTEMDLLRLRIALLMCRMSANGTFLVTKEKPNYSTKLERIAELFDDLADEADRKVVLFSEWTTMLDLIEPLLKRRRLEFVRLDGGVPQQQRQALVQEFQTSPACRFFLTTNAGSTGLNLQAANTVLNVDLPWNPAVLEQRIARAHRMGQKRPVQVYLLVTENTLEENLLQTLAAKKDLALAALDSESDVESVDLVSGADELKQRLEVLLGAQPEARRDVSTERQVAREVADARRDRVASAGGALLGAVFDFLGELVQADGQAHASPDEAAVAGLRSQLEQCVEPDAAGRPRLTVTLPDQAALQRLAQTMARLLATSKSS